MKKCTSCKKEKPKELFSWSNKSKGYKKSRCKDCISHIESNRKYARNKGIKNRVPSMFDRRAYHLLHTYGLTLKDYDNMVETQNNKCAICDTNTKMLVVNHCHKNGKVRGLLCSKCNKGLGMLGDTEESLSKAYSYLC